MPPWLSIHLVLLDSVPAEIRERILEGKTMDENPRAALKSRLMAEIAALEPIISGLGRSSGKSEAGNRTNSPPARWQVMWTIFIQVLNASVKGLLSH